MLYTNKIVEAEGRMFVTNELEPESCAVCGGESVHRKCDLDGKSHYHGRVHVYTQSGCTLMALCATCEPPHAKTG